MIDDTDKTDVVKSIAQILTNAVFSASFPKYIVVNLLAEWLFFSIVLV